ncbi:MAG: hypothetical protein ACKO4K_07050 [Flavobacteriales bacterium]
MRSLMAHLGLGLIIFLLQAFLFNQVSMGWGAQVFALPLLIMMLPFTLSVFWLMLIGFVLGILIDSFSNTYGLHASTLVLVAYLRPLFFAIFCPREGYDPLKSPNIQDMGFTWYFIIYTFLLLISLVWFYGLEIFRFSETLLMLRNIATSFVISLCMAVLFQLSLYKLRARK